MDAASQSNTALIVAVTIVALGIGGYLLYSSMGCNNSVHAESKTPKQDTSSTQSGSSEQKKEVNKYPHGKISIYFGSQTGTAEGFARTLMEEGKNAGFDAKTIDLEEYDPNDLEETDLALFLLATYGEGEPTDNAARFIAWLKNQDGELPANFLAKMRFSVFGLGNRQYEHYNRMGKLVNAKLEALGATRVYQYGEGDDDGTLEEDFENWKASLWTSLVQTVSGGTAGAGASVAPVAAAASAPHKVSLEYGLVSLSAKDSEVRGAQDTKGTVRSARTGSSKVQASNKHLFPNHSPRATLTAVRELRNTSFTGCKGNEEVGSTLHLEIDLKAVNLTYETADNLAIVPENDAKLVEKLAAHLGYDLDEVIDFTPLPGKEGEFKLPYPSPISVRDLLGQCVDIQGSVRHGTAKALLGYVSSEGEREWLADLLSPAKRSLFKTFFEEERRGVADVLLHELSSTKIPLLDLLHVLPAIQPRFYTISSSASLSPHTVHITVGITDYETKAGKGKRFTGLTSRFLRALSLSPSLGKDSLRVFVRASTFRLPRSLSTPVIMVGPGTGIAPMRALSLERKYLRAKHPNQTYGATVLFFGCKYAQMDFIYQEELEGLREEGVLTELYTAFSRDGEKKVYVQDLIAAQSLSLSQYIQQGASVYVCGATQMGSDVMAAFVKLYAEQAKVSVEQATQFFKDLQEKGRYVQELWTA